MNTFDELRKHFALDLLDWLERGESPHLKDKAHAWGYCAPLGIPTLCRVKHADLSEVENADSQAVVGTGFLDYALFNPDNLSRPIPLKVTCDPKAALRLQSRRTVKLLPTAQGEIPESRGFPLWFEVKVDRSRPLVTTDGIPLPFQVEFHALVATASGATGASATSKGNPMTGIEKQILELMSEAKTAQEDSDDIAERLRKGLITDTEYNPMMTKVRIRKNDIKLTLLTLLRPSEPDEEIEVLIGSAFNAKEKHDPAIQLEMETAAEKKGFGAQFKAAIAKHAGSIAEIAVAFGLAFLKHVSGK